MECCIFRPAFGCCACQTLVEIDYFIPKNVPNIFAINEDFMTELNILEAVNLSRTLVEIVLIYFLGGLITSNFEKYL